MTPGDICFLAWAGGLVVGIFVTGVAGIRWGVDDSDAFPLGPAWLTLIWPLSTPYALGRMLATRRARRLAALAEREKWLEAPLP